MIFLRFPSHFPVRATEWMLAAMKVSFGFVLLLPNPTFSNPYMAGLAHVADQRTWGSIAFIFGVVHLTALWINGTKQKSPHWRAACSLVGVLFWFQVCLGIYGTLMINTGMAVYPWLVIFSIRNVWVSMTDARLSDDKARTQNGGRS